MSKLLRSQVLSLLLLSLVGCTQGPDYVRPAVESPVDWRIDYAAAADAANTRWWEQFDDPVLNQLIDTALRENKDVRIAAARVEEFAARLDVSRSGFYPQIGYNGQASRNQASRENFGGIPSGSDRIYNNYAATLNAGWEIDLWGRIRRATEASRAELLAQEENRRTVILSLVSAVANTYVLLRQFDRQLEVSQETLDTRAEALRLFELKFKGGVISELELAQVKVEYEQAAAAIPPLEQQIALTENALSVLLGHNPGGIPRGNSIDALVLPAVPAGTPSSLLANRPDIHAAEQNLVAANARIGVARSQYFPTISLTGLFGYVSEVNLKVVLRGDQAELVDGFYQQRAQVDRDDVERNRLPRLNPADIEQVVDNLRQRFGAAENFLHKVTFLISAEMVFYFAVEQ